MTPTADRSESAAPGRWMRWRLPQVLGFFVTLLWAFAVGAGIERIWRYEGTPGAAHAAPPLWPESSLVAPRAGAPTLVMFVHPRCPCTRASLGELREIMARQRGHISATVLFMRPQGAADAWERTATWAAAQDIPGVTVGIDVDGTEADRFNAGTSGYTVVYGAHGNLLFSGGITAGRGHAGDNDGRRAVASILRGTDPGRQAHPVYGCALHSAPGTGA